MKFRSFNLMIVLALLLSLFGGALTFTPTYAAGFTVTTTNDTTDASAGNGICADASGDCSLRAAIEEANALAGADTITVPAGTYTLTLGSQLPVVTTDITINGNGAANTIIQADAIANTATYRVFEVGNTIDSSLTLDKVTVRHGRCNGSCATNSFNGGGIYSRGILTLTNSVVSNNRAAVDGGGVYNTNNGTLTVTNSTFSNNQTEIDGGGIFNNSGTLTVTDGTFSNNISNNGSGGGIVNRGTSTMTGSTFSGNDADTGGGIINSGTLTISDSKLSGNSANAAVGGGIINIGTLAITNSTLSNNSAISCGGGMFHTDNSATLTSVIFSSNSADYGGGVCSNANGLALTNVTFSGNSAVNNGGGIYGTAATLTHVTFSGNSATDGGGMYASSNSTLTDVTFNSNSAVLGGGMYVNNSSTLTKVTFSGNSATDGGGMYNSSNPTLTNVTFSGNSATSNGGGMYNNGSGAGLTNVTFSSNSATNSGGGVYNSALNFTLKNVIIANSTNGGDCFMVAVGTLLNAQNSLIEDGLTCVNGTNTDNLTGDPVLGVLANNGGSTQTFALLAGSPAIDAGTNTGCPTTDQRGMARPVDGDAVVGAICDIGAYEYAPPAPPTVTFGDVPVDYWAWKYIESIYAAGITGGCSTSPMNYCPTDTVTRAQMAIFLLRGIHGGNYTPPAATGAVFGDVPADHWAGSWIEELSAEGITSGCGNGNYCPDAVITRAEMSIFLLRAKYGKDYVPPAATGAIFADVPAEYWAARWIEQLFYDDIARGCGNSSFCPDGNVTRDQMAVFLQKTFNLPLP